MTGPSRQNHPNKGLIYSNIVKPIKVDLSFVVTATNGLGVTSLKSNGYVNNVFMHTSTTPAANNGYTNPNPAAGIAMIQLRNNFNAFLGSSWSVTSTMQTSTKIDNSNMTAGLIYVISIVGDATLAKWQSIGLPVGVTPAVGVAFVAITVGAGSNVLTSRVQVPNQSGVDSVEMFGNPILTSNSNVNSNSGQYLLAQFLANSFTAGAYTPAGTNSVPTFTGSALGTHAHDLLIKGGQAPSTTNDLAHYPTDILGKEAATDATITGAASATKGGVIAASAGTPAGTVSAPIFTGTPGSLTGTAALALVAPTAGSLVNMSLWFDASSVTVDGL